jgi:hemolysin activation/secretion protein
MWMEEPLPTQRLFFSPARAHFLWVTYDTMTPSCIHRRKATGGIIARSGDAAGVLLAILALAATPVLADAPTATAARADLRFDVAELRVLGNTVLDAKVIEAAVYPFTGPDKHMADVDAARAALERTYHDHGFGTVFVDIPEQSVDEGIVRLRVTEGHLRQVSVSSARYFAGRDIIAALPAAAPGTVPNLPALQKELTALNTQTRDLTVVPVLKAGPQPATVDLNLKVEDHLPFHGSLELNNQYTVDTAHLRAVTQLSYDNMFNRLDSFALQYQVAPEAPSESHVLATSYTARVGTSGAGVTFTYINSHSDVATIGTLGVLGTGSIYSFKWTNPLPASAQSVALQLDYKDFKQNVLVSETSGLSTPVNYINLSAIYAGAVSSTHLLSDWTTAINVGIPNAPYNEQQFADKRYNAEPNYYYLRSDAGLTWKLPLALSATFRLSGQYSASPLISNEQFPIGGAYSVRGYLEAEELGDSVLRASFQFGAPSLALIGGRVRLDEFLFYDAARAFTVDPLQGQPGHVDLRSWGAGLRIDALSHLYGALTWADPLLDGLRTQKGSSTVLFIVRGYW